MVRKDRSERVVEWDGTGSAIAAEVREQNSRLLETYRADPKRLEADANTERSLTSGAYAKRQLFELIQNAVDAIQSGTGRCEIVLTEKALYVANSGEPFDADGVGALMSAHLSVKRDDRIGRFGLGFKSVLAVSDSPKVFSRSGSFEFDAETSRDRLSREFPGKAHYPVMRLAVPLDPYEFFNEDRILDKLRRWATTIVVLPLVRGRTDISEGLHTFPAEFLLFSPKVTRLDVDDRIEGRARQITLTKDDEGHFLLNDANRQSRWIVERRTHAPSKAALADGGYQAARSLVELSWAAPLGGGLGRLGRLWAYFPTSESTSLSGIINAPWKLSDDRGSLLAGAFNDELLKEVLPQLVAGSLSRIHAPERPLAVIEVLPSRGKEARSYSDDILNVPVMKAVAAVACIPTISGKLGRPDRTKVHPEDLLTDEIELWASAVDDPDRWAHPDTNHKDARAKLKRLLAMHDKEPATLKAWIEHLVKVPTVERSAVAVRLVAALVKRMPQARAEITSARVLLLEDGTLHGCKTGQVFLPGHQREAGKLFIDPALAGDRDVEIALKSLGIEILDDEGSLRGELEASSISWDKVWSKSRKVEIDEAVQIFRDALGDQLMQNLRVRVRDGHWRPPSMAYLPGGIIPTDGSRDRAFLVDPTYHQQDIKLLERLGLVDAPKPVHPTPTVEPWRRAAEDDIRKNVRTTVNQRKLPDSSITIETGRLPWPLEPLAELSPEGRVGVVESVLKFYHGDERWTADVNGKRLNVDQNPVWSRLNRYGYVRTAVGPWPVARSLAHSAGPDPLEDIERPLPVVCDVLSEGVESALRLKNDISKLRSEDWTSLVDLARSWPIGRRVALYGWAAHQGHPAPERIRAQRGRGHVDIAPNEVAVTTSAEVFDSLVIADCPALLASDVDNAILREYWGLAAGEAMLQESLEREESGPGVLVVDRFPPLRNRLDDEQQQLEIIPCLRIEVLTSTPRGQVSRPLNAKLDGWRLYTTATQDDDVLKLVGRELNIKLDPGRILKRMEQQRLNQLRVEIRKTPGLVDKLVLAIGRGDMERAIPSAALEALEVSTGQRLDDRQIAQLALSIDGYDVLKKHVPALRKKGLEPPERWAGGRSARDFVSELDFPVEFAGFPGAKRDSELTVEGPPNLGELHDYQAFVSERIQEMLEPESETLRGMVTLPTGAGKTRVAVQALVSHMHKRPDGMRIIWIAETDELCEQAVQTWSQVWRGEGVAGAQMSIGRLWGENSVEERDGHQVVVATVAKLGAIRRGSNKEYEWLLRPTMIVVDEAHRSVSSEYNKVLSALGGAQRVADMTTPLLGLTATPYRGFNDRETKTLVNRYHNNRLDQGAFGQGDVHGYLQERGVLARVSQKLLPGADLTLKPEEIQSIQEMRRVPDSVEQRLAQDEQRNNRILQSLLELPEHFRVLLFATSVENSRTLAALLSFHGVEARAVSGTTDPGARRRYIQDFDAGRVRVLTNYNVFTEGFDVPKVDAVYITRPTYSPNVYQQMIGRGLRGPLNGGKEEVLVVNVKDNFTNFGEDFAFHHFEHLWNGKP